MNKTNAMRILDKAGISYDAREYRAEDADDSGLGVRVAAVIGMPCEQVFKTLVLKGAKAGYFVCCIPVDKELDLKKTAVCAGEKKVEMIPVKDLQKVTGYVRGGCTAVGMKKQYPVFADKSALSFELIAVNAGARGMQLILNPRDWIALTVAAIGDLTETAIL